MLAAIGLVTAACGTHSLSLPAGLSRSDAAIIRAWSPSDGNLLVQSIDGNRFQDGRVSHVYVAPGERRVTVRWANARYFTDSAELIADVRAGHDYVVLVSPDLIARKAYFTIVDKGRRYDEDCLIPRPFEIGGIKGTNCETGPRFPSSRCPASRRPGPAPR